MDVNSWTYADNSIKGLLIYLFFFVSCQVAANAEVFETAKFADELTETKDLQWLENAKERDESRAAKDVQMFGTPNVTNKLREAKDVQTFESSKDIDELISAAEDEQSRPAEDASELKPAKDILELKLAKDFEELKLKLNVMDSQLREVHFFYLRFNIVVCVLEVSVRLFAIHLFKGSDLGIYENIIIFSLNHLQFSYLKSVHNSSFSS